MILFPSLHKNLFLRIQWVQINLSLSLIENAALWVIVSRFIEPSVVPLPLHVTAYFGIDFTAPFWYFYFFPAGGLACIILHYFIARSLYREETLLAQIVLISSLVFNGSLIAIVAFLIRYLP